MPIKNKEATETPKIRNEARHVFHLYVIRAENRNELAAYLKNKGIETSVHYPKILPLLPAYKHLNHKASDFPVAVSYEENILSLPMYPELEADKIEYIANSIKEFYKN